MRTIFFVISLLIQFQVFSQFKFDYNDSIPVKMGNDTLLFPWAGGLNYVQVSDIDFDFDGDLDLFIFDRSKDNIRLFETVTINGTPNAVVTYKINNGSNVTTTIGTTGTVDVTINNISVRRNNGISCKKTPQTNGEKKA